MELGTQLARSHGNAVKIGLIFRERTKTAQDQFNRRVHAAVNGGGDGAQPGQLFNLLATSGPWGGYQYAADAVQRSILFWDTLRRRGDQFIRQALHGLEPVLHFDYDVVLDGRSLERPVNYTLLRIKPLKGVTVTSRKRPYVVIDPRAGHGPGIGGFKDDSQVGVALRAGHPVYFVIFSPEPEPGQTLLDVCAAEQHFVKKVRTLHPESAKPAIIGNCQGGWAAMMLAASSPDDTGPVVINGAPMSYWGGSWGKGAGDNPMRYTGGMLGGTWLASLAADLGNGKFDGAWLVQNFENLNPANSLWGKYYNLYANIDTEPTRFLDFERWWSAYYLMNRAEIEWITRNLFVGNKLWTGEIRPTDGKVFDLRAIKSPIILFASMGDNITPPQQAFNWVADMYGSTEEIKARGQVIVGLMHKEIGHLGIFVSGKVAKKEHTQIVSVLKSIESLPPGLYGMEITERKSESGKTGYDVEFREYRLQDLAAYFNRFKRVDEQPFEAVVALSDFNQRAYELFAQPVVQWMSNDLSARLLREFHPLRVQQWAFSSINPYLAWLDPAAHAVKANRQAVDEDMSLRRAEKIGSELISASLDYYRGMRDASTEAAFFAVYANMFSLYLADKFEAEQRMAKIVADPRDLPFVKEALASIAEGGYAEAFARVSFLLSRQGEPLPLSRLKMEEGLATTYAEYFPAPMPSDQFRRIRGEQEIISRFEPEKALLTLPVLLADRADRERMLTFLDKLMADERVQNTRPTAEQLAMVERIRAVLNRRRASDQRPVPDRQSEMQP
ncbi:MAG TPA: poly(3-hydroxybutyrate) depolymerase [Oxalobacteraceae bacterium]|nr:poly(3-hydroxybutyrate) depolymerase [Oxalobacteraceae bacterium]